VNVAPRLELERRAGVSAANADTRAFAEWIARDRPSSLLDVGTGSGYIAIRLALDGCRVAATDRSPAAVRLAAANARRNGVALEPRLADLLDGVAGRWQAIAFNPPFSSRADSPSTARLKQVVRAVAPLERWLMHRPPRAVLEFRRGLVRRFVAQARAHLEPGGALYLLLYAPEAEALAAESAAGEIAIESTAELRRRNLRLVRLTAGSGGRTGRPER
jgi:methylase of polypeptide subunit release factors